MERDLPNDSSSGSARERVNPLDWAQATGRAEPVAHAIKDYVRRRRRRRVTALAAGFALVAAVGVAWRERVMPLPHGNSVAISTTVSLPARETLPDGSVVELRAGAKIAVEFLARGTGPRRVVLKRGEAHFTVAKDAERPFIVAAGGVEVRAVGTAFSVEWGAREVEVLVTEGRVAVDPPVSAASPSPSAASTPQAVTHVDAGSRAVVALDAAATRAPRVEVVSAAELSEQLAWRVPRLEFNGTPLAEVVAQFNRHVPPPAPGTAALRLVLADDELKALPLSGMLRADNLTVLLQIMESSYGIEGQRGADGEILLRKRQ